MNKLPAIIDVLEVLSDSFDSIWEEAMKYDTPQSVDGWMVALEIKVWLQRNGISSSHVFGSYMDSPHEFVFIEWDGGKVIVDGFKTKLNSERGFEQMDVVWEKEDDFKQYKVIRVM